MTRQNTFLYSQEDYLETDKLMRSILNRTSVVLFLSVFQENILPLEGWNFQLFSCLKEKFFIFFQVTVSFQY